LSLAAKTPGLYTSLGVEGLAGGSTLFQIPIGPGTLYDPNDLQATPALPRGPHFPILALEAAPDRAAIWTKPDDFDYDPADPLAGLGGFRREEQMRGANEFIYLTSEGANYFRMTQGEAEARALFEAPPIGDEPAP
jgi:hypothetical protein